MTARRGAAVSSVAALLSLALAGPAPGADRIYWENGLPDEIAFAALDGSEGGTLGLGSAAIKDPEGLAIDSASQRIFWASAGSDELSFASLFGVEGGRFETGQVTPDEPFGVALDPAAGRLYWSDLDADTISFGQLDGSSSGHIPTGAATVTQPLGIAVDPASGRVFWGNNSQARPISFANLDGSGGGDLNVTGATSGLPFGLAIDRLHGRLYWANIFGTISFANLDGSGGGDLPTGAASLNVPHGVAIDPAGGRIYWANRGGAERISFANLDGSGGGDLSLSGPTPVEPSFPILQFSPRAVAPPAVLGESALGSALSCTPGAWGADLAEAFLYRAPQSFGFQWSRDGLDILGATGDSLSADTIGDYGCRVTARNRAGETTQSSPLHEILPIAFGRRTMITLKLLSRRLTAKRPVAVQIANANPFAVVGKLSVARAKKPAASRSFRVEPRARIVVKKSLPGALRRLLAKRGKVPVTIRAAVTDPAGNGRTVNKAVVLRRKR